MKAFVLGFYLYIGITPLCLYNTSGASNLQDGIFHKFFLLFSYIWEKFELLRKKELTEKGIVWYASFVGAAAKLPFFLKFPVGNG